LPREIVLGNQYLLVNIDKWLQIRDIFFPHVGEENHVEGNAHKVGVYVDDQTSWLNEDGWTRDICYENDTLVSHAVARNEHLQVEVHLYDTVHCEENIFLRKVNVRNLADRPREIKVFFYQDFHIYGTDIGDTAYYDAERNAVVHYKRKRYFLINAMVEDSCGQCNISGDIADYTMDKTTTPGIWEDVTDGELGKNAIAHGDVSSAVAMEFALGENEASTFYYWLCAGKERRDVHGLNKLMTDKHPDEVFKSTHKFWEGVVNSNPRDFKDLGADVEELYKRSLLTVMSNTDNRGAIMASNDSDILKFNRDNYSYCWPRDGAFVAVALDKAGYHAYTKGFFKFCADVLSPEGCLLHKYNPDRSLGSSWHPWVKDGEPHLPIQEDETALTIWALWHHYEQTGDEDFARSMYDQLVAPAAEFMVDHRHKNLPIESHDLWEEREGVLTFTTSTVIAALYAAADFAETFNDTGKADKYRKVAGEMEVAMEHYLWSDEHGRFLRSVRFEDGDVVEDATPESSTYAVFEMDVLEADNPKVVKNMRSLKEHLWIDSEVGGLARYTDDYYHRVSDDTPGNPWFITTIWYGKWLIAKAESVDDLVEARDIIQWVVERTTGSGLLPEQLHPYSGEPLSVSPLTWSHSSFIDIINDYIAKYDELS
jgi:GH15 family glucan-1,4-alpha-glucosidase